MEVENLIIEFDDNSMDLAFLGSLGAFGIFGCVCLLLAKSFYSTENAIVSLPSSSILA